MENKNIRPLFSFGVIADVQHADVDDSISGRPPERFYRHALDKLNEAVKKWNEKKVDFAVQLGDIIDGFSKIHGLCENDFANLLGVVRDFKSKGLPVRKDGDVYVTIDNSCHDDISPYMCHLWGNHEFYNFSRSELWKSNLNSFIVSRDTDSNVDFKSVDIDSSHGYYYSFSHEGFRFIALDPFDIGKISRPDGSDLRKVAMETLEKYKKGDSFPTGSMPQIVSWNGALSNAQLSWLHSELQAGTKDNQKVIILTHVPLHPMASRAVSVIWNYPDVLLMINSHDCVVACLAGHYHEGGYFHDQKHNIHHLTFPGVIERDPETNAYAVVEVYQDCLKVNGFGELVSRELRI